MAEKAYAYIIVGAGLAGASAVEGIRERDKDGPILLLGRERHLPYDRPHLSKKLWFGKKKVEDIFLKGADFYASSAVDVSLETGAVGLDPSARTVTDNRGGTYGYEKLLLATGGTPRTLGIPGGTLEGVCYFRSLDDYLWARNEAKEGRSALVIGGGFIGSEMAAALRINGLEVTLLFPGPYPAYRVFPEGLGRAIMSRFAAKGVRVLPGDSPASIEKKNGRFLTRTGKGKELSTDMVIAGIGIVPETALASSCRLEVKDGIVVDDCLQTSAPGVFAAGDNAFFRYQALGKSVRVEHWDNAVSQGKQAGRNMAGGRETYDHMPYFFSDLFEFGYEAVGEVDSRLKIVTDWQAENDTGVVYYLKDQQVRGVMMCNVWGKVDAARKLIWSGERVTPDGLKGAVR